MENQNLTQTVEEKIEENDVVLFIKGEEDDPYCGFSERALLLAHEYVDDPTVINVLEKLDDYRDALEEHTSVRTIPQVFVQGEFIGGSDELLDLYRDDELEDTLTVN